MEHFWSNGLWDLLDVSNFLADLFSDFIDKVYESEFSWLFYMALLVPMIALCFDIILSIILSLKIRQVRFVNILSPRSWSILKTSGMNYRGAPLNNSKIYRTDYTDSKYKMRDFIIRKFKLTPFAMRLKYKKAKAGDYLLAKDGYGYFYAGIRLDSDNKTILYKYRGRNGIYFSKLSPYDWANASGSQRMDSVKYKMKRKGDK